MKKISTTQLSKNLNISKQELDNALIKAQLIEKKDKEVTLTDLGSQKGGEYKDSPKYGKYIVWPEDIDIGLVAIDSGKKFLSPSAIGEPYKLSPRKVNMIFSELGWIEKYLKGWTLAKQGMKQGGVQKEHPQSGAPFVVWPETIHENQSFMNSVKEVSGDETVQIVSEKKEADIRTKFPAKHRSTDGHFVRSKAEMLIDNWLYMEGIAHAYERKLPIEEDMYCDFYIPVGKVYIEYWGYENEPKYLARKKVKQELYKKYDFKLIELNDEDVLNLDDILPRMLLKFGVQTY
jgi:hypothetical protein